MEAAVAQALLASPSLVSAADTRSRDPREPRWRREHCHDFVEAALAPRRGGAPPLAGPGIHYDAVESAMRAALQAGWEPHEYRVIVAGRCHGEDIDPSLPLVVLVQPSSRNALVAIHIDGMVLRAVVCSDNTKSAVCLRRSWEGEWTRYSRGGATPNFLRADDTPVSGLFAMLYESRRRPTTCTLPSPPPTTCPTPTRPPSR